MTACMKNHKSIYKKVKMEEKSDNEETKIRLGCFFRL